MKRPLGGDGGVFVRSMNRRHYGLRGDFEQINIVSANRSPNRVVVRLKEDAAGGTGYSEGAFFPVSRKGVCAVAKGYRNDGVYRAAAWSFFVRSCFSFPASEGAVVFA